ncbi:40S ribosomal protein S19-3 [Bienertia sinuspersici]
MTPPAERSAAPITPEGFLEMHQDSLVTLLSRFFGGEALETPHYSVVLHRSVEATQGCLTHEFVKAYAAHLKRSGKIELPPWTDIVKTGVLKELAPIDPDWYYIRAASMTRKIYLRGGLGVGAFRRIHGGSKRNGSRPPHFGKSRSSIARHILQQLEKMIIVEIDPRGGRKITSSGQRDLDQVSGHIGAA